MSAPAEAPAAAALARLVYGDGRGWMCISRCKHEPGTKTRIEGSWRDEFFPYPQALDFALERARQWDEEGFDVYVGTGLLTGKSRKKENAADLLCLFADIDDGIIPADCPPTALVESSPGRLQAYWRLTEPVKPALAERLNKRMAVHCGADMGGWDISQVLRLSDTHNHTRPGDPLVRLTAFDAAGITYTVADLDGVLPELPPEPERTERRHEADAGEPPIRLTGRALETWRGEHPVRKDGGDVDRSRALVPIGRVLKNAGLSRAVIVDELAKRDAVLYQKYTERADAIEQYHAIVDELERTDARQAVTGGQRTAVLPAPVVHTNGSAPAGGSADPPAGGVSTAQDRLPVIVVTNRQLRETSSEALAALHAMNARQPDLFERAGQIVRIRYDEAHRPQIEDLDRDKTRGHLARAADWQAFDRRLNDYKNCSPPMDVAADLLAIGNWGFPPLAGITELPPVRVDGSICTTPGYDPETCLYYAPAQGFRLPVIPAAPTLAEIHAAAALIDDILCDFPFVDDASHAAAPAAVVTAIIRPAIPGNVPLFLIDKPKAGTGASLLADVVAIVATGRPAAMQGIPSDDEEFDKRVLASLVDGSPVLVFDNADEALKSASLARMLTSSTYRGRVLGQSRMVDLPQRAVVLATGNNLKLRGDIGRRSIWCRMDAHVGRPWERDGFRHPELLRWVTEHRADIVAAALTLMQAWLHAGRPDGSVKPLGSFEAWTRIIGGILRIAGVQGFLGNLRELYDLADEGATQWAAFLGALADEFGGKAFTSAEVAKLVQQESSAIAAVLPDDLAAAVGKPQMQRAIGTEFGKRVETRFDGLRLVKAGSRDRAVLWKVLSDPKQPADPDESLSRNESLAPIRGENASAFSVEGAGNDSAGLSDSSPVVKLCPVHGVDLREPDEWCVLCPHVERAP